RPAAPGTLRDADPLAFFSGIDNAKLFYGCIVEQKAQAVALRQQNVAVFRSQLPVNDFAKVDNVIIRHPLIVGCIGGAGHQLNVLIMPGMKLDHNSMTRGSGGDAFPFLYASTSGADCLKQPSRLLRNEVLETLS